MTLQSQVFEFNRALKDEIEAVRKQGGQKTYVSDGRYLGKREAVHIYSFAADSELRFPDDTKIDLEYRGEKYTGSIVSIEGFDLILALSDYVADSIPTAILYTAPWYLLEELQKRLSSLLYQPGGQTPALSGPFLDNTTTGRAPAIETAQQLLHSVAAELGEAVAYNDHQLRAVGQVLANDISYIWGPPGTGKTRTLGLTAAALVAAGESVLIVAHSNVAVDVAMLSVVANLHRSSSYLAGGVLRFGVAYHPDIEKYDQLHVRGVVRQQNPELIRKMELLEKERRQLIQRSRSASLSLSEQVRIRDQLAHVKAELQALQAELKQAESALIGRAQVVGCTLSKATIAPEVYQRRFDAVLIDEASMAYIPHCVFMSSLAQKRLAIFGDFRQLAPISQADTQLARRWLQRDIFDHAGIIEKVNHGRPDSRLVLLATQYRMHPDISAVPNRLFYGGQLKDGPRVREQALPIVKQSPGPGRALVLYDLSGLTAACYAERESHSRFNFVSALATTELAYSLVQTGQKVGIVTPYNAQSRLIHRLLKDLKVSNEQAIVATVHRFQGSEADIILFDAVEGAPSKPGLPVTGGMNSSAMRLSNVAVSRARAKFIALVNSQYVCNQFDSDNCFRQLVDEVARRSVPERLGWPKTQSNQLWQGGLPGLDYYPQNYQAKEAIEQTITLAREEIAIVWPGTLNNYHFSAQAMKQCDSSRVRFFISGEGRQHFFVGLTNAQIWETPARTQMGLVAIDRKQLWVYLDPGSPVSPVLRLNFPETTKLLYAFWRLVPDQDVKQQTLEDLVEQGKSPLGGLPCPRCNQLLWLDSGRYGLYLKCTSCGHTKRISESEATNLARLMKITCGKCRGQVRGRRSRDGYIFLGCVNYPECKWTKELSALM